MVDFMEKNVGLARGAAQSLDKEDFKNKFIELQTILNSLGPPLRNGKEWEKVWRDYKQKIKAKVSHNKKEMISTGGGPCSILHLSQLEEKVISLLKYDSMVHSNTSAFGLQPLEETNNSASDLWSIQNVENIAPLSSRVRSNSKVKTTDQFQLLEAQTVHLAKIQRSVDDIGYYAKKILQQQEKRNKLYEKELEQTGNYFKEKLMHKNKILNLELQRVNLAFNELPDAGLEDQEESSD